MRALRAEAGKLTRPLVLALAIVAVALSALSMVEAQSQGAESVAPLARAATIKAEYEHGTITLGQGPGSFSCTWGVSYPASNPCQSYLAGVAASFDSGVLSTRYTLGAASLAQNPVGAGVQAGGGMASLLGFMIVMILAAGHVGGEWSGRTLRVMLVREPNRWKILAVKAASLWLASLGFLLLMWATTAAVGGYYRLTAPLDPIGGPGFHAVTGLAVLGKAAVVLAVYSVLGTAFAALTKGVIGTLTAGMAFGAASFMGGYTFSWLSHHEFVFWVSGFVGFGRPTLIGSGTYWLTTFANAAVPTAVGGLLGITFLFGISAAVAGYCFRCRDLAL